MLMNKIQLPKKAEIQRKIGVKFDKNDRYIYYTKQDIVIFFGSIIIVIPKGFQYDGVSRPYNMEEDYYDVLFGLIHDYGYKTQFIPARAFWDSFALVIYSVAAENSKTIGKKIKYLFRKYAYYATVRLFAFISWSNNKGNLQRYANAKAKACKLMCRRK